MRRLASIDAGECAAFSLLGVCIVSACVFECCRFFDPNENNMLAEYLMNFCIHLYIYSAESDAASKSHTHRDAHLEIQFRRVLRPFGSLHWNLNEERSEKNKKIYRKKHIRPIRTNQWKQQNIRSEKAKSIEMLSDSY